MAVVGTPSENYRIDRMEKDLHDLLLEVRAMALSFQTYQLAQPNLFITRREYDDDAKTIQTELSGLRKKYTGILVSGLLLLSGLVVGLATEILKR